MSPIRKKAKKKEDPDPGSSSQLTITEVGAIKVSASKRLLKSTSKQKSKDKRPKLSLSSTPQVDIEESSSDQDVDGFNDKEGPEEFVESKTSSGNFWDATHMCVEKSKPLIATAFDEIALEGLDGITLQALWTRLAVSLSIPRSISRNIMIFVWNSIKTNAEIKFYQLPEPRGHLKTPSLGGTSDEIYPYVPINDHGNKIIGSCSTYNVRKQIDVSSFSLAEAEALGYSLVIVASQEQRSNALINPFVDPRLLDVQEAFVQQEYYILEKTGRGRRQGATTYGPYSLCDLVKDSKTLFYYRNNLQGMRLVAKQNYHMKTEKNTNAWFGLIHLQRFYVDVKTQKQMMIEFIIKMIKQKPDGRMEYMELRQMFDKHTWDKFQLTKVIKSPDLRQFVKTDVCVPYRLMYPNASRTEWKQKGKDTEKILRIFELRNPHMNITSIFKDDKDDPDGKQSSDSEAELDIDTSALATQRVYQAIYNAGPQGITMRVISAHASVDHYIARNVCKNLKKLGLIHQSMQDLKRQHYMVYIASEYTIDGQAASSSAIEESVTSNPKLVDDDEVCDFIGNVLKVNPGVIKITPELTDSENMIVEDSGANNYTIIKVLKRVKDTDNLNVYFANKHGFNTEVCRPLVSSQKIPELTTKTKNFFSKFIKFNCHDKESITFVPVTQHKANAAISQKRKHRYSRRAKRRTLDSIKPFNCLLDPTFNIKSIETYISDDFILAPLSSSDEEPLEYINSTGSNASGLQANAKDIIPDEVKAAIIDHFQLDNAALHTKLNTGHIPEPMPMAHCSSREEDMSVENFFNVYMEIFMGPKPRVLSVTKDVQDIETLLVLSTSPDNFSNWRPMVSNSSRVQARIKLIKETVYKQKTVIDLIKLYSIVNQTEAAEGYNARVDRKSLHRIFTTLVKEGEFLVIKIILKYRNIIRTKNVLTEAKSDVETLIHSIVDQFKNSFVMYAKRKFFEVQERSCDAPNKVRRRFKYNRFIGRTYGACPKVSRMRILHEFLFYIMREYTGSPITREDARDVFLNHCGVEAIDSIMNQATTLYQKEATWRMFIPPLPEHKDWTVGWALISDILLRLPLSLFVKVYNVSYIIPELPGYLNHPIRKHFIVKNLPSHIKDALLGYRKYIFSIHEIICYLAYIGLVQFGPQKLREKDQVFIYLNTKAVAYDTSSSERGYHHVTRKEYPRVDYDFNTYANVEKYWADMYYFAINTKLGNRYSVIGQSIKLEYAHAKPLLSVTLKPQTPETAQNNDIGYLPGDGLGACCTDSSLWVHVPKNWYWYSRPPNHNSSSTHLITGLRRKHLEDVKPAKHTEMYNRRNRKIKVGGSRLSGGKISRIKKSNVKTQARSIKKKVILRKVIPRRIMKKRRIRVDMIDKRIIDKMGKTRAIFTADEDKLVLIALACSDYLTELNKKRSVASCVIRDFIHRVLPTSDKKTSLAYRRRGVQLRKRNSLDDHKEGMNFQMISDYFTEKHFGKLRNDMKRDSHIVISDAQLNVAFVYLAHYTWHRHRTLPQCEFDKGNEALKDYLKPGIIEQFNAQVDLDDNFCKDPTNDDEICFDTIQSVIHSSLGNYGKDQQYPLQLLKVYQTFSEDLLRSALVNMRDYQIISGRKLKQGREGTILMSGVTYNLSFNYTFKQITLFPHCIFTQGNEILLAMQNKFNVFKTSGMSFEKFEHGHGLGVSEFQTARSLNWVFDLPDDIITLNPNMSDFRELIQELSQRYTQLMRKSKESNDGSYDPEVVNHLESALQSYIQVTPNSAQVQTTNQIVDAPTSLTDDLNKTSSIESQNSIDTQVDTSSKCTKIDLGNYGKADRRHKSWRISDMAFMLTKGLFPELDDDERLEKLNEHFIVRYPTCRIRFNECLMENDDIFTQWHHNIKIESEAIIEKVLNDSLIRNVQIRHKDFDLDPVAEELVNYILRHNSLGATSADIKAAFPGIDVIVLLKLIEDGLVLRVGVCNFFYVHHNFRQNWSIYLNNENQNNPEKDAMFGGYRLRIAPWVRINGSIDDQGFEKWLSIILSHCLSYPSITFNRLCARFNIIKPVDIYYILEVLQRLRCLRIWCYQRDEDPGSIFSNFYHRILPQVPSNTLDDFDDVFVETDSAAITKFGSFLNRHKTDFAYVFEEEE